MYLEDGSEQEFFPNERLEIVLDVIKQYVQDHPNELRRVDILNSILVANKKFSNKATERRSKTKDSLKGCNEMNASLEGKLKELGCMVMGGYCEIYKVIFSIVFGICNISFGCWEC